MNRDKLDVALAEAERFIERAQVARAALEYVSFGDGGGYERNNDTRATAACRRASMDLTRALADLRRPL